VIRFYTTTNPAYGQGNYPYETGPGTCQIQGELNSLWLKFSVIASGDLAFTLYPASNMDYDWALYNLTNDSCESVQTNGSLLASCNSSQYAITGISSSGVGNWNSFGPTNAFNTCCRYIPVNCTIFKSITITVCREDLPLTSLHLQQHCSIVT
jgi:hypothetical protein